MSPRFACDPMAAEGDVSRALARELAAWLGQAPRVNSLQRLRGGESSECYRFDLTGGPASVPSALVLRLMRDDRAAAHECAVQTAVAAQGFPTPAIRRSGSSASAFGRPFCIMAFVVGRDPVASGAVRRLPQLLAATMAELHALKIALSGRDIQAVIDDLRRSERREIAHAAMWFDDKAFAMSTFVLCHGDLHARNILMNGERVVALLDWEIAVFAPPAYDVARTELLLRLMPGVGPITLRPLVRLLGRRASRQFVDAYRAVHALDATALEHCRALHALRLVALVRSGDAAPGVHRLWRPFEAELARRWEALTGVAL